MSPIKPGEKDMAEHAERSDADVGVAAPPNDKLGLIQIEFPERVTPATALAMFIGALFVAASFAPLLWSDFLKAPSSVMLGAGVGIILAAFGGQATVRGKGYVLAGVGALAVLLAGFLEYQRGRDVEIRRLELLTKTYARGAVYGIPNDYSIVLKLQDDVLGYHNIEDRQYKFIVFQGETDTAAKARLELEKRSTSSDNDLLVPINIELNCIVGAIGEQKQIDWQIRASATDIEVLDRRRNNRVIGRAKTEGDPFLLESDAISCTDETVAFSDDVTRHFQWAGFSRLTQALVPQAKAQEADGSGRLSSAEIVKLLEDIHSDDVYIRRGARDALSEIQTDKIPTLMQALREDGYVYRTKLGISVALAEKLRKDKEQAAAVSQVLTDEDRELLLNLAGDNDRTVRVYAVEFLYDLGDVDVAKQAIQRAAGPASLESRYGWLYLAQTGWEELPQFEKDRLRTDLETASKAAGAGNPKTQELIRRFN